jgi:signal transduction histidine kinase
MKRRTADTDAVRRAVTSIGWQIMLATGFLVFGIVAVALLFVLHQSHTTSEIYSGDSRTQDVFVDQMDLLQALIVIGIGAVIYAGAVSWFIARRAVHPLGEALALQREFVRDASRALQTPLAHLDEHIGLLQRDVSQPTPPTAAESAFQMAELRTESRALISIVDDLLLSASGAATHEGLRPMPARRSAPRR